MTSSPAGSAELSTVLQGAFPPEVASILERFAAASIAVRAALATAPLSGMLGATGAMNVQGERTAKLDDHANEIFKDALRGPSVARLISEEETEPVEVGAGPYTCAYDPLDGSSNIGFAAVGSVLGVYEGVAADAFAEGGPGMTGRQLVAAAFTVYGLPTLLIVASKESVAGFAFHPEAGEWRLAGSGMRIPKAAYTSINWTYRDRWPGHVVRAVDSASDGLRGRYSGSMVEDILRVLMAGGVFLYPEDSSSPNGKLRMLYEVCPVGFIMEAAGGAASNGMLPVLDVPVRAPHQRSPFVAGAADAVSRYDAAYSTP